jgi:hypothetical protein
LPDRTDKILLYYLTTFLIDNKFKDRVVEVSRYQIAKNVLGSFKYDRIMLGLKRWHSISISFQGVFYNGDSYSTRYFHVIDNVILKENKLKIFFNVDFLEQIKNSQYFKYINFNEYKRLKRPVSARLYEILIKTFKDREIWKINILKLAEKLTLEKRYPSQILEKLKPAVNEINNKTELKFKLEYNQKTQVCTFTKLQNAKEDKQKEPNSSAIPEDDNFKALTSLLPIEHQGKKTILESIANFYKTKGFDYTARNIKYTNQHCNGSYRAYLNKALQQDWGLAMQEDEERKQKIIKEQEHKREQEQEELRQQIELQHQVKEHIKTLSPKKLEALRTEAISQLDEETKRAGKLFGNLEMLIQFQIEKIVLKKVSALIA